METIKLTRQQLYDLVWTKPMYELCQQFGLSDNGLRKNCKKLNIPIPYIGYWSKLKYGKNPEKPPLPKTLDSSNAVVELKKLNEEELARHKFILEEDKPERTPYDVVKDEIDKMNPKLFIVPKRLYAKDPLIINSKEYYRNEQNHQFPFQSADFLNPQKDIYNMFVSHWGFQFSSFSRSILAILFHHELMQMFCLLLQSHRDHDDGAL